MLQIISIECAIKLCRKYKKWWGFEILKTSSPSYIDLALSVSVMLSNLSCSTSECGMDSLIFTINDDNSINRPLSIQQLHHEIMIRKMAPHPLHAATTKFLLNALYRHFGGGSAAWSLIRRSYFHKDEKSHVISRHFRDVLPYKLFLPCQSHSLVDAIIFEIKFIFLFV